MATVALTLARFTQEDRSEWLAGADRVLSEAERQRVAAITDPEARTQHAIGRATIRLIGSRSGDRPAQGVAVAVSEAGKPWLPDLPHLHVSVAHTRGLVVVAACRHTAVGVDVEHELGATKDPRRIAQRFFNETEVASLGELPDAEVADWFSSAWTIKEAVGKALGVGMVPALSGAVVTQVPALSGAVVKPAVQRLALTSVWSGPPADRWTIHQLRDGNEKIAVALPAPNIDLGPVLRLTLEEFAAPVGHRR